MSASIITIGDEILIGQIIDTNSSWIASKLTSAGISIDKIITVADQLDQIVGAVDEAMKTSQVVFTTGGLGPTKDDITKQAFCQLFNTSLSFHQRSFDRLTRIFAKFNIKPMASHRIQCYLPQNAQIFDNPAGTAPGMWMEREGKILISTPGVPHEMKGLLSGPMWDQLYSVLEKTPYAQETILTVGGGESFLAEKITSIEESLPDHMSLAYLPGLGRVRIRVSGTHSSTETIQKEVTHYKDMITEELKEFVFGYGDITLQQVIGNQLRDKKLTISTAESCTGGKLASMFTQYQGSSDYFIGSVVAYSNVVKSNILGVSKATLDDHGAVSQECVEEMAINVRKKLGADIGIATSGIAGPGGGTNDKPVGTIHLALSAEGYLKSEKLNLFFGRSQNIEYTTYYAMNMVRKFLNNID